jgi:hypothetical protein
MNLQSEIQYFNELARIDKARLLTIFLHELAEEARSAYGPANEAGVHDATPLRLVNELVHRVTRVIEQLLVGDQARPADDLVMRLLLAPRSDKSAERMILNAYRRTLHGFDRHDTTVLMDR